MTNTETVTLPTFSGRPQNPLTLGERKRPTKKHRAAVWENMLGTVYACSPDGEVRYFDHAWQDAVNFAQVTPQSDARTYRADRRNWSAPNYASCPDSTKAPRHGQQVLWVR